jgi:hypothetical protein
VTDGFDWAVLIAAAIAAVMSTLQLAIAPGANIGALRKEWIENLRVKLADLNVHILDGNKDVKASQYTLSYIMLMLNESEPSQKRLGAICQEALLSAHLDGGHTGAALRINEAGRAVMKAEWDRASWEMYPVGMLARKLFRSKQS